MSARDWQPGDKALIEVEVTQTPDWAPSLLWVKTRQDHAFMTKVADLLPVAQADEAAIEGRVEDAIVDEIHNRLSEFVSWAEDTDDASCYHVLDDVPVSEVALVARKALAAANLLASPDAIRRPS